MAPTKFELAHLHVGLNELWFIIIHGIVRKNGASLSRYKRATEREDSQECVIP